MSIQPQAEKISAEIKKHTGIKDVKIDTCSAKTARLSVTLKGGRTYEILCSATLLTSNDEVDAVIARINAFCDIINNSNKVITNLVETKTNSTLVSYIGKDSKLKENIDIKKLIEKKRGNIGIHKYKKP